MNRNTISVQKNSCKNLLQPALILLLALSFFSTTAMGQVETIDFEGLVPGQVVNSVLGDGGFGPVTVEGTNVQNSPEVNSAVIFDSDCPGGCTGGDPDLGSPNQDFGGPGIGTGGEAGQPYQNDAALGNILIVHERPNEITDIQPGLPGVTDPDDEVSATSITLEFPEAVTVFSFTIIDRESTESQNIELFDEGGTSLGLFTTPPTGDNGVAVVETDAGAPGEGTPGVKKIVMNHRGSGGLDNIVFLPPPPPPPPGGGCTYTIGFWKNHPDAWPVDMLTLGGVLYNKSELLDILNTPPRGDKSIILAYQLIAAKLNVENGADPTDVSAAITAADDWLVTHGGVGSGQKKWNGGESVKNTLDSYNNGFAGPGHCDDVRNTSRSVVNPDRPRLPGNISAIPESFSLDGNYPNPFNPQTSITFSLPESAHIRLSVYDMLGRELDILVDGTLQAGQHTATFEAGDLPSGTYLYRLVTPEGTFTSKMILAK